MPFVPAVTSQEILVLLGSRRMWARPDGRQVPRFEADLRRRRAWPQPEITLLRVHKQRVRDEAVLVLARRLPLGKRLVAEEDRLALRCSSRDCGRTRTRCPAARCRRPPPLSLP